MSNIIEIEEANALIAFQSENGLDPIIDQVERMVEDFEPDVTTAKGRKECASFAHKISSFKVYLDNLGKDLTSEWKKKSKMVDSSRKSMRDRMDELKARARKELLVWESVEEARIKARNETILSLNEMSFIGESIEDIRRKLTLLELMRTNEYEEFTDQIDPLIASKIKEGSEYLVIAIKDAEREEELQRLREAEQARLEQDRIEKERIEKVKYEEAIREEARLKEIAKKEAEVKAIEEANRRALQQAEEAKQAEIRRVEREVAALKKAEEDRIEKERLIKEEEDRKQRDLEYKELVKKETVMKMKEYDLDDLFDSIANGEFKHLKVQW